jgi:pilus assembly protein Flp/PilA
MRFIRREEGQGLVEYGLILILIAVVVVVFLSLAGQQIGELFSRVANAINI